MHLKSKNDIDYPLVRQDKGKDDGLFLNVAVNVLSFVDILVRGWLAEVSFRIDVPLSERSPYAETEQISKLNDVNGLSKTADSVF